MATQTVYLASSVSGNNPNPANALGAPNGTWAGTGNANSSWTHRWRFTSPTEETLSSASQSITLRVKKGTNSGTPTITGIAVISQAGSDLYRDTTSRSITSTTGIDIPITFTANGASSAGVQIEITTSAQGGSPSTRNGVDLDAVTWVASGVSQEPDVPNVPPVAVAGNDMTVEVGKVFTLDGSASYDPDGSITNYRWYEDAGGFPVLYSNGPDPVTMTYIGNERTAVFYLTVTDNDGATSTDSVAVTAVAANQPPVANAGPDGQGIKGGQYTLDGSASYDLDGTIVDYEWALIDIVNGSVTIPGTGPTRTVTLPDANANYILTVTDDQGATDTDAVTITLSDPPSQTTQWYIVESGVEVPIFFEGVVEAGSISAGTLAPASDPTLPPTDGGGEIITPVNPGGVT